MTVACKIEQKGKLGFSVCSVRLQSVSRFILYIIYNKIYILLYIIYIYENAHTLNEFAFCLFAHVNWCLFLVKGLDGVDYSLQGCDEADCGIGG